jgi:hypothetical protein|tara:strand:- start:73 stop:330 length:258 start_codon:yes stop_codon:yes gene_type:complete
MILREYIQMEKLIHGREIPADILYQMTSDSPDEEYMYYSESKGSLISIFDMHIHHFIRAYAIQNKTDNNSLQEKLSEIKKVLEVA